MDFLCLCPTYGYPKHLVQNAIACFLRQDYPAHKKRLLILDDYGNILPQSGDGWEIRSTTDRFASLPDKYNAMWKEPWGDAIAVWEVDDIYLPWHLKACAAALEVCEWAHPNRVWSTYTGVPQLEWASGRFHAALSMRRASLEAIGGWPATHRADFDQQLLAAFKQRWQRGVPDGDFTPPSYVFRWGDTASQHGQGLMKSPEDETWYKRAQPQHTNAIADILPRFDTRSLETIRAIDNLVADDWRKFHDNFGG